MAEVTTTGFLTTSGIMLIMIIIFSAIAASIARAFDGSYVKTLVAAMVFGVIMLGTVFLLVSYDAMHHH